MNIRKLVAESALFELRRAVTTKLSEAINKHLLSAAAVISNRKDTDKDLKGVDVDTRRAAEAYLKAFATKVDLFYNKVFAAAEATQAKAA